MKIQKSLQKEGSQGPALETTRLNQAQDSVLKGKEGDTEMCPIEISRAFRASA